MQLPRLRFTVRRMMVMVAVVAVCLSPVMLGRRMTGLRDKEATWAMIEAACLRDAAKWENRIKEKEKMIKDLRERGESEDILKIFEPRPYFFEEVKRERRLAGVAAHWKRVYHHAMIRPWVSVPIDPLDQ